MSWLQILIIDVVVIGAIALSYVGTIHNVDRKLGARDQEINQKIDTSNRQINQKLDMMITRLDESTEKMRELRIEMRRDFDRLEK